MKIIAAPNALKGSLDAVAAANAIASGILAACPQAEVVHVPVADGGDGLVRVLAAALDGEIRACNVTDPLGKPVSAEYCWLESRRTAVIEMALASGLALLKDSERDPLRASTFGTGELMAAALKDGAEHLVVGIGGSATNDGGMGMAAALGIQFLDEHGNAVEPCGAGLARVARVDASGLLPDLKHASVEVVCDVDNPLLGERGAAHVYSPQKGASPEDVDDLERGMKHFASVVERDLNVSVCNIPGTGAAGGLGAGLMAFAGGQLRSGVDVVLDLVQLDKHLAGADLVITAEGAIDAQTAFGKAPAGVAKRAKKLGIPCIAIAGGVGEGIDSLHEIGIDAVFSLCRGPVSLQDAMRDAATHLTAVSEQCVRLFFAGRNA